MKKYALILACIGSSLFGAASSSQGPLPRPQSSSSVQMDREEAVLFGTAAASSSMENRRDGRVARDIALLNLLAQEESEFVRQIIDRIEEQNDVPLRSLLIKGSPRNGKKSLAREMALISGRTFEVHRLRSREELLHFISRQASVGSPHIAILQNVHRVQHGSSLEPQIEELRRNRYVFFIATAELRHLDSSIPPLFDYEIEIKEPGARMRRQILEYYLAGRHIEADLMANFVRQTERVSSGKLSLLANQLMQGEGNITQASFDEIIRHITIPQIPEPAEEVAAGGRQRIEPEVQVILERLTLFLAGARILVRMGLSSGPLEFLGETLDGIDFIQQNFFQ